MGKLAFVPLSVKTRTLPRFCSSTAGASPTTAASAFVYSAGKQDEGRVAKRRLFVAAALSLTGAALAGCTVGQSYYVKSEMTEVRIRAAEVAAAAVDSPADPKIASLSALTAIGTTLLSDWAKAQIKKDEARYTASWTAFGWKESASGSRLNLEDAALEVVRTANGKNSSLTDQLTFQFDKVAGSSNAYRIFLNQVDYPMTKAKVARFLGPFGGSPKETVDVTVSLKVGAILTKSGSADTVGTVHAITDSVVVLHDIDPYGNNASKERPDSPRWQSAPFVLPAGSEVVGLSVAVQVTETAAKPVIYEHGADHVDKLIEAIAGKP